MMYLNAPSRQQKSTACSIQDEKFLSVLLSKGARQLNSLKYRIKQEFCTFLYLFDVLNPDSQQCTATHTLSITVQRDGSNESYAVNH